MDKLDIVMAVPGMPFNGETVKEKSLGGSETAGYQLAVALGKLHHVTLMTNIERPGMWGGVSYMPISLYHSYCMQTVHDVNIVQRAPELFKPALLSKANLLWCHDLAILRREHEVKAVAWNIDRVVVLSDFMRQQYQDVYKLPPELVFQTRNGIDLELIEQAKASAAGIDRDRKLCVYAARPERGLDVMLRDILPALLKADPEFKLALCTYDNKTDAFAELYAYVDQMKNKFGPAVIDMGSLSKPELYKLYLRAGVYAYPTPSPAASNFREVSCISAMEAQACGLPIVTSNAGALPETVAKGAGRLIDGAPGSKEYAERFAQAVIDYSRDTVRWEHSHEKGMAAASKLGWGEVAEKWTELCEDIIREKSSNRLSLAYHFYKRSDILALKEVLAEAPGDTRFAKLQKIVDTDYAFTVELDGYRIQYEKIGATHDEVVIDWSPNESRFDILRDWLKSRDDITTALDYGCAHGAYATNLCAQVEKLHIMGVDIDSHGVAMGKRFADKLKVADRCAFQVATYDDLPFGPANGNAEFLCVAHGDQGPGLGSLFDCAIAQEVLEHVPEPWKVITALEDRVRDDGWVYLTVPFGPWEYTDYKRYPHRAHIWEFDIHDLRDMLAHKKDVYIAAMPFGASEQLGDLRGWWVVRYKVKAEERGAKPINMKRKLWLQSPRQAVSVNMMAGPGSEDNLHWCLKSLEHIADQLVIVNCGMNDEALRIAGQYDAQIVPGPDPRAEGFETPRNLGLEHCVHEWILWIDTDERLMDSHKLGKFLKSNIFAGYSINQHHFACDTRFEADKPVRLFRRNSGNRWYGMIHEHPEKALNQGPGITLVIADVHIAHVGYLVESGRRQRFVRNFPLLQADIQKYPDRLLQKHFIMRDNMIQVGYILRTNGHQVTEEIQRLARETVELYRKYFIGKTLNFSTDPISYYSQALAILGEGFELAFQVAADKVAAKPNGVEHFRFANDEEAIAELTRRVKEQTAGFTSVYW